MSHFVHKRSIILLDGGVGGEIFARAPKELKHHWGNAAFLGNGPEIAKNVHLDYFKAGSHIATANSYIGVKSRLIGKLTISKTAEEICKMALEAAQEARKENGSGLVAGSLGPLFNSYRSDQDVMHPFEVQVDLYSEYIKNLSDADILIFETVASIHHAQIILVAVKRNQPLKPVWISFTVDDNDGLKLRSGELLSDAKFIAESGLVDAVLVNCSMPEAISKSLTSLKEFCIPFGAYGNGFKDINAFIKTRDYTAIGHREDLKCQVYADFVIDWIKQGAQIVGGCCEIGPEYISTIAQRITDAGYELTKFNKSN
ncbi:MMUM [Enterospora canceri]|uniref:MMUM n=1 Tax=Enterospora canceri TaxID=1081671 RepID=A0A1Y1S7Z9_9MICR|nr:MMUM [Enterospora canceri]